MTGPADAAPPALIALDWGTSSLRAWLMDAAGGVIARRRSDEGLLRPGEGGFAGAFDRIAGDWRRAAPGLPALAAGMIGSAQGWAEAPYARCPAGAGDLAAALAEVPEAGLRIVPGLRQDGARADVMRGEETQILGALAGRPDPRAPALLVLPGTHSKWAGAEGGRVTGFTSFMTGELFAVLRDHSILGRIPAGPDTPDRAARDAAFRAAVDLVRDEGRAAPLLFSTRARVLTGSLDPALAMEHLSGLLIGEEIAAAPRPAGAAPLLLVGAPALCDRYAMALQAFGLDAEILGEETGAAGLWLLARRAGLVPAPKETAR